MKGATITYCQCPQPRNSINPRKAGSCLICGRMLDPEWVSSESTMQEIFKGLAWSMPYGEAIQKNPATLQEELTDDFLAFWADCSERERAGRPRFGFSYLARNNEREALEEWADGANYLAFSHLKAIRDEGDDEDMDVALTAMFHAFKAHQATRRLSRKRHGAP